ncbi:MAG TPA: nucleotide exchange factor GrpE [Gammaproteobacteria bacterium]|nr:nucleotide exchange factor GrpE [Gammaproteobacteria bacterium]
MADQQREAEAMQQAEAAQRPDELEPETAPGAGLEEALAAAERKADEHRNDYLRLAAELDNVRKRAQRDLEQAHKFAIDKFVIELLPVKDSLELSLNAPGADTADGHREGIEMTLKLLDTALEKHGVSEVDPVGEVFNPEYHEAMAMQPSDEAEPDTVLNVVQKGYVLNGRLLRPARVIVAREP